MRKRDVILPAGAGLLCLAILGHLMGHPPNPADWPRCEYFRCRDCGGSASIDPDQPERWGCRACGYSTWRIAEKFRTLNTGELSGPDLGDAMERAGVFVPDGARTPATIYWQSQQAIGR